ncbi:MAG: hypothetical protein WAW17_11965 [Rhodococcus sp. (in: high G+C Gram-positive bacteria)]|uniref:hypothetical protein n=1 Tax=Rhodococcus sp. TaxID=1831 RepID=UPI003BB1CB08
MTPTDALLLLGESHLFGPNLGYSGVMVSERGLSAAMFGEVMTYFGTEHEHELEHELDPNSTRRARLAVAAHTHAADCRTLLSILGILPEPDTPADP